MPKTRNLSRAFDEDLAAIRASPRALRNGVVVLAPRATEPPALMVSCQMWPFVLRSIGIRRVAVVLGVQSYLTAEPMLRTCVRCMKRHRVAIAFFHEGHLASDHIQAWFDRRKAERHVTSDLLRALGARYAERGDTRGAYHALELAEKLAG